MSLLLSICLALLIFCVVLAIINMIPFPAEFAVVKTIMYIIFAIVLVVWLLGLTGVVPKF